MNIALDAMGGDHAPAATVEGAVLALKKFPEVILHLLGDEDTLAGELEKHEYSRDRLVIHHTSQVVSMDESPAKVHRTKRDSSLVKGILLQKEGLVDGFVSAGNTGAVLTAALFILGRIKGVMRPALAAFLPNEKGGCIICDAGANADVKPLHILQFAQMASVYMEHVYQRKNPRVGLLNIGQEKSKGKDQVVRWNKLLTENLPNFYGNVEGRDVLQGTVDIVVTDGFTGNIVLKMAEGIFRMIKKQITTEVKKRPLSILGSWFMKPVFHAIEKDMNYEEYGGAPLLGINGVCIVCHGSSSPKAIMNGIRVAISTVEQKIIQDTTNLIKVQVGKNSVEVLN